MILYKFSGCLPQISYLIHKTVYLHKKLTNKKRGRPHFFTKAGTASIQKHFSQTHEHYITYCIGSETDCKLTVLIDVLRICAVQCFSFTSWIPPSHRMSVSDMVTLVLADKKNGAKTPHGILAHASFSLLTLKNYLSYKTKLINYCAVNSTT